MASNGEVTLPDGYVRKLWGGASEAKGTVAGDLVARVGLSADFRKLLDFPGYEEREVERNGRKVLEVVRVIEDFTVPFPVSTEAIDAACESVSFSVTDEDGEEWEMTGVYAAAQGKFLHAQEALRGDARKLTKAGKPAFTVAQIRARADAFLTIGGRERTGSVPVALDATDTQAAKDLGMTDELRAFLTAKGMMFDA